MTSIFDLAIFLGGDGVIFQVFFGMAWTGQRDAAFYVGQKVGSLPGFIWNAKDMTLSYEGETYGYTSFGIPQGTCFLIKKEDIQKSSWLLLSMPHRILSSSTPKAAASPFSIKRAAASWEFP